MKIDITKYSVVRVEGLWLIGIVERNMLKSALELQCNATINQSLTVHYQACPILFMPENDEIPILVNAMCWPVSEMPESRRKQLAEAVNMAEEIRRQMKMQAGTSLHLATSLRGVKS